MWLLLSFCIVGGNRSNRSRGFYRTWHHGLNRQRHRQLQAKSGKPIPIPEFREKPEVSQHRTMVRSLTALNIASRMTTCREELNCELCAPIENVSSSRSARFDLRMGSSVAMNPSTRVLSLMEMDLSISSTANPVR